MSQRWRETICLCVSGAWPGHCSPLSVSPLWPLTDRLTGLTGRKLSGSHWLPLHCLGSNSGQLARSSRGRHVCSACVRGRHFHNRTSKHWNVHRGRNVTADAGQLTIDVTHDHTKSIATEEYKKILRHIYWKNNDINTAQCKQGILSVFCIRPSRDWGH